jgi:hypothetical protein
MNSRESAAAQQQSVKAGNRQPRNEKSDPLLRRYLSSAYFKLLADRRGHRDDRPKNSDRR